MRPILFIIMFVTTMGVGHFALGFSGSKQERNKQTVVAFYRQALNEKDFEKAAKYLGKQYKQHNPFAQDGREGLKAFITYLRNQYPNSRSEIKRVFADGDYVILHVHSVRVPGERGRAIVDIFRLEKFKIVEHWHVAQEVPEKPANSNGMF